MRTDQAEAPSPRCRTRLGSVGLGLDGDRAVSVAIDADGVLHVGQFGTSAWEPVGSADDLQHVPA
jgi:hypothetical protein